MYALFKRHRFFVPNANAIYRDVHTPCQENKTKTMMTIPFSLEGMTGKKQFVPKDRPRPQYAYQETKIKPNPDQQHHHISQLSRP